MKEEGTKRKDRLSFGVLSPLLGSLSAVLVLGILAYALNWLSESIDLLFLSTFSGILKGNLYWFLVAGILLGYVRYAEDVLGYWFWLIKPFEITVTVTFILWILSLAFSAASSIELFESLLEAKNLIQYNLSTFFFGMLFITYALTFMGRLQERFQ
ncbi:MAG: hypothetical protein GF334_08950 [Candidatus Altiarchaeales archaeon]|nr:hypothetical protein [Candidatus Altiarchaeales archaeon]